MAHVYRKINRADSVLVEAFAKQESATVYEAAGQVGMMDPAIKPVYPEANVCGTAVTVKCHPGDNLMLHKAVTVAKPGDVLVATIGKHTEAGAWGEILATAAMARGIVGLVIDGAVRDSEAMKSLDFPVFARGLAIGATMKRNIGTINHPLVCGNVLVNPGDIILGDADGVVVIAREDAQAILEASQARVAKEDDVMAKIRAGSTTLQLLGLDPMFKSLGLTEEPEE